MPHFIRRSLVVLVPTVTLTAFAQTASSPITQDMRLTALVQVPLSVHLSWSPARNVTSYTVERKSATSSYVTLTTLNAATLTWRDANVTPGVTYTYRVTAVNGARSASSKELTVSVPASAQNRTGGTSGAQGGGGGGAGSGGAGGSSGSAGGRSPNGTLATWAFSDAAPLPPMKQQRQQLSALQSVLCRVDPPGTPLTTETAVKGLLKHVTTNVGPAPVRAFESSPDAQTAEQASAAGAAAVLAGQLEAALLAFLTAHRLQPHDAVHLVNAAGVANAMPLPAALRAAPLALLDAAGSKGTPATPGYFSAQAIRLNNRGHALNRLGKWADAERALTQALAADPRLAEASLHLSLARLCQGRTEDAVASLRLGLRRAPPQQAGKDIPVARDPSQPDLPPEEITYRRPAALAFDLSEGRGWTLPYLHIGQTPLETARLMPTFQGLMKRNETSNPAETARLSELDAQLRVRLATASPATRARVEHLRLALNSVDFEPSVRDARRGLNAAGKALNEVSPAQPFHDFSIASDPEAFKAECRKRIETWYVMQWRPKWVELADASARYANVRMNVHTALLANFKDSALVERELMLSQNAAERLYYNLAYAAWRGAQVVKTSGCYDEPTAVIPADPVQFPKASVTSCADVFGSAKLSVTVKFASLTINCENIEVKAATAGWIGAFGSVSQGFAVNAPVTLAVGVEASASAPAGLAQLAAGTGVAVTIGSKGVQDVVWHASAGGSVGINVATGPVSAGQDGKSVTAKVSLGVVSGFQYEAPR